MICATATRLPYADQSAHMAATSQPYYLKRRYEGVEPCEWPAVSYSPMAGLPPVEIPAVTPEMIAETEDQRSFREWMESGAPLVLIYFFALQASAVKLRLRKLPNTPDQDAGILGLEPDPFAFIGHSVLIYREVRRVLRDDGVLCVNIGDSYVAGKSGAFKSSGLEGSYSLAYRQGGFVPSYGLKPKDLVGIPWRLAFALQADGWYLRSRMPGGVEDGSQIELRPDIIWEKNAMPESVRDRPSVQFEDLFLFSKSKRYAWDQENGRTAYARTWDESNGGSLGNPMRQAAQEMRVGQAHGHSGPYPLPKTGANMRASWRINTEPTSEAHYAAWPRELVRRLIRIGTSDKGCCPECGSQWRRVTKRVARGDTGRLTPKSAARIEAGAHGRKPGLKEPGWRKLPPSTVEALGWSPTCDHEADPVPCSVLDPFSGIGRTGEVCFELKRRYMPAEVSIGYAAIQARRLADHRTVARGEALRRVPPKTIHGPLFGDANV